jgi:hypothetical protein
VIEFEGPIHTEEIARRIREAFGLQKTGKRILTHVNSGLNHLSRSKGVDREKEFWSITADQKLAIHALRLAFGRIDGPPLLHSTARIVGPAFAGCGGLLGLKSYSLRPFARTAGTTAVRAIAYSPPWVV